MQSELGLFIISDKLYISNEEVAENKDLLKIKGITHIVSIGGTNPNDNEVKQDNIVLIYDIKCSEYRGREYIIQL
jgi:hypothetical protein